MVNRGAGAGAQASEQPAILRRVDDQTRPHDEMQGVNSEDLRERTSLVSQSSQPRLSEDQGIDGSNAATE